MRRRGTHKMAERLKERKKREWKRLPGKFLDES